MWWSLNSCESSYIPGIVATPQESEEMTSLYQLRWFLYITLLCVLGATAIYRMAFFIPEPLLTK